MRAAIPAVFEPLPSRRHVGDGIGELRRKRADQWVTKKKGCFMPGRWISGHFRSAMILSAASILPFVLVYTILPRTALALPPGAPGCLANIILQLDTPDFAPNPPDPDGCGWIEEDHV